MASGSIIDENIKSLCCLLWIFETRIAVMIITDQHQHRDCEEDITIFDIIEIIAQLYVVHIINGHDLSIDTFLQTNPVTVT